MTGYAMKVIGVAGIPEIDQFNDYYIASYADTPNGRGDIKFSVSKDDALKFATPREALEYWRRISRTVPIRPDGKPNRPLTAFTIELVRDDDG